MGKLSMSLGKRVQCRCSSAGHSFPTDTFVLWPWSKPARYCCWGGRCFTVLTADRCLLPPQNSRCVRASLRPSRLYRGYATHSGESGCVAGFGGWNWFCWCIDQEGICSLVLHETRLLAVGFLCGVTLILMGLCVPCLVQSDLDQENEDNQYLSGKLWAAILPLG